MTTSAKQPRVRTKHPLSALVGKTIESITMQEVDMYGGGSNVRQFYTVNCTGNEQFVFGVDGNSSEQYATVEVYTPSEYQELLDSLVEPF